MKTLRLETILQSFINSENTLYQRSLVSFLEGLTEQLLDLSDTDITCPVTEDDFLGSGNSHLRNKEMQIELTDEISLTVNFDAVCEFEYNTVDETSVGLGSKGDICGLSNSWIEINKITLYTQDGSEFYFHHSTSSIAEYLNNVINIE